MKKALLALALISVVYQTHAADIRFQGEIVDETCSLEVNGVESPTILLPSVSRKDLASQGQTAGEEYFTIVLKGCNGATANQGLVAAFLPNGDVNPQGRLLNGAAGGSEKVSLELRDDTTPINLASSDTNKVTLVEEGGSTTGVSKVLNVRYYAEASGLEATAVEGSVQYLIHYQ